MKLTTLDMFTISSSSTLTQFFYVYVPPGAMNSVKLLMESAMKSGFLPLYNFIYNHTFESMPSAFFIISIVLTTPLIFVF